MINVFILGSKGIPAQYGGFETFVEQLTRRRKSNEISYFVSCMDNSCREFEHNGAHCFGIKVPPFGPLGRMIHVSNALAWTENYIKNGKSNDANIVYILGYRIGPFLEKHVKKLHLLGAIVVGNPDGLEWKRDKWNKFEKLFLRHCERCMVLHCDYLVCDSKGIADYVKQKYSLKNDTKIEFIPYGCDSKPSICEDQKYQEWLKNKAVSNNGYFLIVGRFVPENNFELMIREFMASKSDKDLVIITNVEKNKFYKKLQKELSFKNDARIKFVGVVYDEELLKKIRENAAGYIHGHSVGGTNPSLLEALASTKINYLFDVPFNKEVGGDEALYFSSEKGALKALLDNAQTRKLNPARRVNELYSWHRIVQQYEDFFIKLSREAQQ